ncbi:hypothetical protein GYMLUDRAFT_41688 [Collybiopsis luxurians FD-317 M1]|uniref:BTB domain-containing protein n=1 Tax=Collybiopsis luxurians FD-317 M1 TaxID=944289 RepID=A0A0D0CTL6_9AGAR|nr:hypothetical protein GYMLUDRAFT_41688 [Collybiopsis luxurians FD-317 M1]
MESLDWNLVFERFAYETGTRFYPGGRQSQVPTPPDEGRSPKPDDESENVSISTKFGPNANLHCHPPDLLLSSSDSVRFYVHSDIVLGASNNGFRFLVPTSAPKLQKRSISVPEHSSILGLILHMVYGISCSPYVPPLDVLSEAIDRLALYGLHAHCLIQTGTPFYASILAHVPFSPMDVYILAAKHRLHELAVSASSHLISFSLSKITDRMAEEMGPEYLRKLFFLHLGRSSALKELLLEPPRLHAVNHFCSRTDQRSLTRAWALASAYLAWDARADVSAGFLEATLNPLVKDISCEQCRQSLHERIKNLLDRWAEVKCTI